MNIAALVLILAIANGSAFISERLESTAPPPHVGAAMIAERSDAPHPPHVGAATVSEPVDAPHPPHVGVGKVTLTN